MPDKKKPSITRLKLVQELEREFGWTGLREDKGIQRLLMDVTKAIDMINARKRIKP